MRLLRIPEISIYSNYLQSHPEEPAKLKDFLTYVGQGSIHQGNHSELLLELLRELTQKQAGLPIKVWMPFFGGIEFVISEMIRLELLLQEVNPDLTLQIFATDSDQLILDRARNRSFHKSQLLNLDADVIQNYFTVDGSKFSLRNEVRKRLIIAKHDLLHHPPYSGISILRIHPQLLRFSKSSLEALLEALHFSLVDTGLIIINEVDTDFPLLSKFFIKKDNGVYCAKPNIPKKLRQNYSLQSNDSIESIKGVTELTTSIPQSAHVKAAKSLAQDFLIFDEDFEVSYIKGEIRNFLLLKPGFAQLNLRRLLDANLQASTLSMFKSLQSTGISQTRICDYKGDSYLYRMSVVDAIQKNYALEVIPVNMSGLQSKQSAEVSDQGAEDARIYIEHLEEELAEALTRYSVMNEEMQTANEELQSANEELETSSEELTSLNEELSFTNLELEHKIAEIAFAREEAEKANLAKTRFLASMSHELRTPLNVIVGLAQELYEREIGAENKSLVVTLKRASDSLMSLINDVLDLSKIDAGQMELYQSRTQLKAIVQEVIDLFRLKASPRRILFKVTCDINLESEILIDSQRYKQILINLVSNAVKFTDSGTIFVQLVQEATNRFTTVVRDTGRGMSPQFLEKIFQPYTQERENENAYVEGTGLGLAIVFNLVQSMGGSIEVDSAKGHGTEFRVNFPLVFYSAKEKVSSESQSMNYRTKVKDRDFHQPLRVLIVDDSFDNRMLLKTFLKKSGYHLNEAENGMDALHLYEQMHHDVILMDLVMPECDGYETTRMIREFESKNGIDPCIVVAVTAHALKEVEASVQEAGFDHYLTKPVIKSRLLDFFFEIEEQSST